MTNSKVQATIDADRRLVILRLLVDYRGALNSSTLDAALRAWGHRYVDRALILDDMRWLERRSLVNLEDLGRDVMDAMITPKGERTAAGTEWVEGVARPAGD